jgi:hypothetical protein
MTKPVLAACLLPLLLVAAAACTRADSDGGVASVNTAAAASATPSLSVVEQGRRHAHCMRDHGVPEADPIVEPNGGFHLGGGYDKAAVGNDALRGAEEACKQYLPVLPPEMRALKADKSREFSRCMRARGLANFPDPEADGQVTVPESIREDPRYDQAKAECDEHVRSYSPHP